jgi:hypothetical protein
VDFDSPAKPVSLAQYDICLLRLHADIDESCIGLMPARRLEPPSFCSPSKVKAFWFINPFPVYSSRPKEPEIKLAHISPPAIIQRRGWIFSCLPADD